MISKKCILCGDNFPAELAECPRDSAPLITVLTGRPTGRLLSGRYRLLEELGRGAMGVVFLSRDEQLGRLVAVKMLLHDVRQSEASNRRFALEARAASLLNHPSSIRVYDFAISEEGLPFIVMEYLDGTTLEHILKRKSRLPVKQALPLFQQVSSALTHAHRHQIIHRDLKPGNIMVISDEMAAERAVLMDFGIARLFAQPGQNSLRLTRQGEIFGTPLYMSPEQCMGQPADERSDIYSLACIFYETLAGLPPHRGKNYLETIYLHLNKSPRLLSEVAAGLGIPVCLRKAIRKALSKDPDERFPSVAEFATVLTEAEMELAGSTGEANSGYSSSLTGKSSQGESIDIQGSDASYDTGCQYYHGDGVPRSYEKALDWFLKAAEQGHGRAQVMLGHIYNFASGVPRDKRKAFHWYQSAAQTGDPSGEHALGTSYLKGDVVDEDLDLAFYWLQKAADKDLAGAQNDLGKCYENGWGVREDDALAQEYYQLSAYQGCGEGQYNLARCYRFGIGINVNLDESIYWLTASATRGYTKAQIDLASCYQAGYGVLFDLDETVRWLQKAADTGSNEALFMLAEVYETQLLEVGKATHMLRLLAANGFDKAQKRLLEIDHAEESGQNASFFQKQNWGIPGMVFWLKGNGEDCAYHFVREGETLMMISACIAEEIEKRDPSAALGQVSIKGIEREIKLYSREVPDWDCLSAGDLITVSSSLVARIHVEKSDS